MTTWICKKGKDFCNGGSCIVIGDNLEEPPRKCIYEGDKVKWIKCELKK